MDYRAEVMKVYPDAYLMEDTYGNYHIHATDDKCQGYSIVSAENAWRSAYNNLPSEELPTFTIPQMLEAITYGFQYYRDSMHDNVDVPEGNKLQWLLSKYVPVEDHGRVILQLRKQ